MYERSARYARSNNYNNYLQTLVDAIAESDNSFVGTGEDVKGNTLSLISSDDAVMCCMAMIADCLACQAGVEDVEEWCKENPEVEGCVDPFLALDFTGTGCCNYKQVLCTSCYYGVSVERFCAKNPREPGCEVASPTPATVSLISTDDEVICC